MSSSDSSCDSLLEDGRFLNSDSSDDEEQTVHSTGLFARLRFLKRQQTKAVLLMKVILKDSASTRNPKWNSYRIIWEEYLLQMTHQDEFEETFRMSYLTFQKLVKLLRKDLLVDELQAYRSTQGFGAIYPEMIVAFSLRWLAGGQWQDLKKVYGVSRSYLRVLVKNFCQAVLDCSELCICCPANNDIAALKRQAALFESRSSKSVFRGCVGVLDGLLVKIQAPTEEESANVLAYFSGHYKCNGLNIQAMADHRGRFLFFAVAAPGSFPDANALALTVLLDWINGLPPGFFVLADNAYILSETVLIPFSGSQRSQPENSCYNFLLSQLRIRIEQAFGHFTTKWRIFRKPVSGRLVNTSNMLMACARLHNFVIDNDWEPEADDVADAADPTDELGLGLFGESYHPNLTEFRSQQANSFLRDAIVDYIEGNAFRRPLYNRVRNSTTNFEQYEEVRLM